MGDDFDDLKQFIDSRLSQTEVGIRRDMASLSQEMRAGDASLRQEMRNDFSGIAEAIEAINNHDDSQDKAIKKLANRVSTIERSTTKS